MEASPTEIAQQMLSQDAFSHWLGIELDSVGPGSCRLRMRVRSDMLNGFGLAHGGITFSLADTALAVVSNGRGRHALSIDTRIQHLEPVVDGDQLIATARQLHLTHRIGRYRIEVHRADEQLVALFDGIVYRKSAFWSNSDT